jgi:hypothetical protein
MSHERWDPRIRPPASVCPERFCFFWLEVGDGFAPGFHQNLEASFSEMQLVTEAHCGCSFGVCTRSDPERGDNDWYEPCEPFLERAGLPRFYFTADLSKTNPELRDESIRAARKLWGEDVVIDEPS